MTTFGTAGTRAVATAFALVALAGCSSASEPRSLAGTSWQLTAIQSMDDAEGSTPVPDPGAFTVAFGTDGHATFRFDCNSGSGSFESTPSADGTSGSLTFGTVAVTEMGCPGPSLDQKVGAALPHVTSYLIRDEHLNMSLMADGGILTWRPAG
ncbi:META domain-containing protein [Mycolicibacterium komossense]|uniref:META domain-containing protein n=1 Tax=Mycolicibacterium komossense TaxID=1779 RepID=A0ABT3C6V8_9MYCO|nr:META domain-containing protein [Mycolicibacterium komossense]MCV7225184.1 META domain-containing protein [Mycolicibacterium komossense]